MGSIELPATLTVRDEDVYSPEDPFGEPVEKIIMVSFGDHEVARYKLKASVFGTFFLGQDSYSRYDTPEEFLAEKLKKLFELIE